MAKVDEGDNGKRLLFVVTESTRQLIGEIQMRGDRLVKDEDGFSLICWPLQIGELFDRGVNRAVIAMKPVMQTVKVEQLKVKVSEWMDMSDQTQMYESVLTAYRASLSGIAIV